MLDPLSNTYGFGNITSPRFHDPQIGRMERLRARFAGFGGPVREYSASLSRDEQIHCSPIDWLELDEWQSGRVILIGDAAHTSIPMMGQGGCLAMEDAYVLAEVLREAFGVEKCPRNPCEPSQTASGLGSAGTSPRRRIPACR